MLDNPTEYFTVIYIIRVYMPNLNSSAEVGA